jgi:hypothetical protein
MKKLTFSSLSVLGNSDFKVVLRKATRIAKCFANVSYGLETPTSFLVIFVRSVQVGSRLFPARPVQQGKDSYVNCHKS